MAGRMVHVEIPSDDTGAGRDFWGSLFGWQFQAYPEGSEYHMARLTEDSGAAVSGMEGPGKRGLRVYFEIDDMDASVAKVRELGGEANDKMPVPSMGWFSVCKDSEGNEFGLWQHDTSAPMPEM
jgi:predicted enzyme related to lactoylglutathione lyase